MFSPPLAGLLSIAFLPSLFLSSSLSPHLMRPHNNTAVVQLFCYLSQTAGSRHSVFLVPFACLLRQGNEYHSERRSTKKQKEHSDIWGYTSKHHFVGTVSRLIKEFHTQRMHASRQRNHMFGACCPAQPGAVSARPRAPAFK